ncbi:MAG: HNH endonuclease signature motif containing protein, partial [Nocardioidaceae bacterium]
MSAISEAPPSPARLLAGAGESLVELDDLLWAARTAPIWKAMVARDKHCAFPGCRRPPIACDAHHIVHWADGGGTGLDNLVLAC